MPDAWKFVAMVQKDDGSRRRRNCYVGGADESAAQLALDSRPEIGETGAGIPISNAEVISALGTTLNPGEVVVDG